MFSLADKEVERMEAEVIRMHNIISSEFSKCYTKTRAPIPFDQLLDLCNRALEMVNSIINSYMSRGEEPPYHIKNLVDRLNMYKRYSEQRRCPP